MSEFRLTPNSSLRDIYNRARGVWKGRSAIISDTTQELRIFRSFE